MKKLSVVFLFACTLLIFQSCEKDPILNEGDQVAPELPPVEAFVMPFSGYEDADTTELASRAGHSRTLPTFRNWFHGAVNVVVWNSAITRGLAIPVASFYESFNHTAQFQGNGVWLWSYNFVHNNITYSAELEGKILASQEVQWDMYISQQGGFQNVHWYTGITAIGGAYSTWTLNHRPNNPETLIGIEYQRNDGNGVASIRYTNIVPNHPDNGDYIEYKEGEALPTPYNRSYDVYRTQPDNLLQINWNQGSNEGRVKDPKHYQDEEWHCWDTNYQDTQC